MWYLPITLHRSTYTSFKVRLKEQGKCIRKNNEISLFVKYWIQIMTSNNNKILHTESNKNNLNNLVALEILGYRKDNSTTAINLKLILNRPPTFPYFYWVSLNQFFIYLYYNIRSVLYISLIILKYMVHSDHYPIFLLLLTSSPQSPWFFSFFAT